MQKPYLLLFASVLFWGIGAILGFLLNPGITIDSFAIGESPYLLLALLTTGAFVTSALFFGYGSLVAFILIGLIIGEGFAAPLTLGKTILYSVGMIPVFLAGYAGILFGRATLSDMQGNTNLLAHLKIIGMLLGISLVISLIMGFIVSSPLLV